MPVLAGHGKGADQRQRLAGRPVQGCRYHQRLHQAQQRPALLTVFQIQLGRFATGQQPVIPAGKIAVILLFQRAVLA